MLKFFAFYDIFLYSFAGFLQTIWRKGVEESLVKWSTNLDTPLYQ